MAVARAPRRDRSGARRSPRSACGCARRSRPGSRPPGSTGRSRPPLAVARPSHDPLSCPPTGRSCPSATSAKCGRRATKRPVQPEPVPEGRGAPVYVATTPRLAIGPVDTRRHWRRSAADFRSSCSALASAGRRLRRRRLPRVSRLRARLADDLSGSCQRSARARSDRHAAAAGELQHQLAAAGQAADRRAAELAYELGRGPEPPPLPPPARLPRRLGAAAAHRGCWGDRASLSRQQPDRAARPRQAAPVHAPPCPRGPRSSGAEDRRPGAGPRCDARG